MTNKDLILSITDKDKSKRIEKILALIKKKYIIQAVGPGDKNPANAGIVNIIVPAKRQKGKIVVFAHHDVHTESLGYNDDSSGIVTLLKLQDNIPDNVELVFTDAEERGGQGCRYYLENCEKTGQINFEAINLDVVGLGDCIFYETYCGKIKSFAIPEHMKYFKDIPFSDSRILESYNIPNILMITGYHPYTLIENIFKAQHGGGNDSRLDLISEDVMDLVFDTVLEMVKGKHKSRKSSVRLYNPGNVA